MLLSSMHPVLIRMLSFLACMIELAVVNPMCTSLKAAEQKASATDMVRYRAARYAMLTLFLHLVDFRFAEAFH